MDLVAVLTGAGISAESGLSTFRGEGGLWEGYPVEKVATPEAFHHDPGLVYRFYNMRRAQLQDPSIEPNPAHIALAMLEKKFPDRVNVITQNVDNLHERAGSQNVFHMHGELNRIRCLKTGESFEWMEDLDEKTPHPKGIDAQLRPHIVWFGEMPMYMGEAQNFLETCDVFLCIGTSGMVYPAAGFVNWTKPSCRTIEFNLGETEISHLFKETITGPASQTVPEFISQYL